MLRRLIVFCVVLTLVLLAAAPAQAASPPVVRIAIPAMGLTADVLAVSGPWSQADFGNEAWTLDAIGDQVGWLDPAGGPSDMGPGNIVLAGHYTVPSSGAPGAFYYLDRLNYGDFITAQRPGGSTHVYRVVDLSIVDDGDLSVVRDTGDGRLTLIGCLGTDYAHRLVVVAEPLGPVVCREPGVNGHIVPCIK